MTWQLSGFADEAGDPIVEQIRATREAELRRVDLRFIDGVNISELPMETARAVRKALDDAGVSVLMLGSPIGKIDIADDFATDLARLEHLAEMAKVFDTNWVRIFSYFNNAEASEDAWAEASLDRLKRLRDAAGGLGLVLYHENEKHIFGDTLERVLRIREELRDGETFRLIFDFDNYNQCGDDVFADWEALRDATDAFHFKDSAELSPGVFQHVPMGQGTSRSKEILADAVACGWSGPVVLEPHLAHSSAVLATGPGGEENRAYAALGRMACYQVAADTAKKLLTDLGVDWS